MPSLKEFNRLRKKERAKKIKPQTKEKKGKNPCFLLFNVGATKKAGTAGRKNEERSFGEG